MTAATCSAVSGLRGAAMPRLTASADPAAIRTCPALKADLTGRPPLAA